MSPSSPFSRRNRDTPDDDSGAAAGSDGGTVLRPTGRDTVDTTSAADNDPTGADAPDGRDAGVTAPRSSRTDTSSRTTQSAPGDTGTTSRADRTGGVPLSERASAAGAPVAAERAVPDRSSRRERREADRDRADRDRAGLDRTERADRPAKPAALWQSDLGLLGMRLVLAASFIGHGSQKVFGAFNGSGIDGFANGTLSGYGFRYTETLSWVTGLTELIGGVLVAVGFLTPLAAAGLLAIMVNTVVLKFHDGFFFQDNGFEIDLALAGLAGGVLLNGPGRIALDAGGFLRRLLNQRWLFLIIGVGSALAVYFGLRN